MTYLPQYIERQIAESGRPEAEALVALVKATEEQTRTLERIARVLEEGNRREESAAKLRRFEEWGA